MPVNDSVVVAVNVVLLICGRYRILQRASEVVQEAVALIKAVRNMPVIVDRGWGVLARC